MKKLKRLLYSLTIVVALVFTLQPIQANAEDWTTYTVHVTRTGSKYHRAGCSYLKSDIPINILDAVNQGYTPCSRCNPPYPTITNKPSTKQSSNNNASSQSTNTYSQSEGITFTIYYDANGNPIQDTIYRGYYASWTAEYYRRILNNELDSDILYSASTVSFDSWTKSDQDTYLSLSDNDRLDFIYYQSLQMYDYILDLLGKNSSIFDWKYYSATYPDKWESCNHDVIDLFADFIVNGEKEGLQGSPTFNVYTYINNNPDLVVAFGNDLSAYYTHYRDYGQYEGRIAY